MDYYARIVEALKQDKYFKGEECTDYEVYDACTRLHSLFMSIRYQCCYSQDDGIYDVTKDLRDFWWMEEFYSAIRFRLADRYRITRKFARWLDEYMCAMLRTAENIISHGEPVFATVLDVRNGVYLGYKEYAKVNGKWSGIKASYKKAPDMYDNTI